MCRLLLSITSMKHFSMPNSIPMVWLHILKTSIRVSDFFLFYSFFFFFANRLMSSMYIRWFIFSCHLLSLYTPMHFLQCSWVASLLLQIVMVLLHLPGIYRFGSSLQLSFPLLCLIPLSRFSWFSRQSLWLPLICCTFRGSLLSSFAG